MYLSFSGWKQFGTCPHSYWHRYPGKTVLEVPENRVNSLYGSTVGRLFEIFYADSIWRQSGVISTLSEMVEPELDRIILKEERTGCIDWKDGKANYHSRAELVEAIRETIPRGLEIIRLHRLIGRDAQAEVKLDTQIEGHTIGGRADFVMTRVSPHDDLIILDGKGSRHREKYVDDRQLLWYAMLYRLRFGRTPDKLGFVYWRSEPEKSVDWVFFSDKMLDEMQETALSYARKIEESVEALSSGDEEKRRLVMTDTFQAQPGDKCRLCAYRALCPPGQNYTSKGHQIPVFSGAGVEDVGLDV